MNRLDVTTGQVAELIATQFPQWADLPVRAVDDAGWDNKTFHLGTTMSVRLPSAAEYSGAVAKEHRWLPVLAPQLPLPIPVPLALGAPGAGYPFAWSVYSWLDGAPARASLIGDLPEFATDLAGFLAALGDVPPADGPTPGQHNWFRGGPLLTYDGGTRSALAELDGKIDTSLARSIWDEALAATWDGDPRWFHGDVAYGNLLVREGRLAAVIDFGTCGVGDPSCDLAIAWTLLSGPSRAAFREQLGVDDGTWARGRGWALWKALITYTSDPNSPRVIEELFATTA